MVIEAVFVSSWVGLLGVVLVVTWAFWLRRFALLVVLSSVCLVVHVGGGCGFVVCRWCGVAGLSSLWGELW